MPHPAHILTRTARPLVPEVRAPCLNWVGEVSLVLGRVHEVCGLARRTAAVMLAARSQGPVFWIAPSWTPDHLNGDGLEPFADPTRFTFFTPTRPEDLLWAMEETLRSGEVPLVIADIPAPPSLTAVRRLHLAAETGTAEGKLAPLGGVLTPGEGGAQRVETRWHMAPAHRPPEDLRPQTPLCAPQTCAHPLAGLSLPAEAPSCGWHLSRRRARALPPKSWHLWEQPPAYEGAASGPFALSPLPALP